MIDITKVSGSGFTLICSDNTLLNGAESQSQESINEMCVELEKLLQKYNFSIEMIGENEEIMRLQGRILFMKFFISSSFILSSLCSFFLQV